MALPEKIDLSNVENFASCLRDAFYATCQPRSDLQIERFVIGDHETSERQYKQCIDELVRKIMNLRRACTEKELLEYKIEKLRAKNTKLANIKIKQLYISMDELNIAIEGSIREANTLWNIYNSFPIKYTAEDIQNAECKYWYLRLSKLAQSQIESKSSNSPDSGTLDALKKLGVRKDLGAGVLLEYVKSGLVEKDVIDKLVNDKVLYKITSEQ
jgi:hypothetical protein